MPARDISHSGIRQLVGGRLFFPFPCCSVLRSKRGIAIRAWRGIQSVRSRPVHSPPLRYDMAQHGAVETSRRAYFLLFPSQFHMLCKTFRHSHLKLSSDCANISPVSTTHWCRFEPRICVPPTHTYSLPTYSPAPALKSP